MSLNPIFNKWSQNNVYDKEFSKQMNSLWFKKDEKEINKIFSQNLRFIGNKIISAIGVGTNLINEYTIAALAKVLAHKLHNSTALSKRVFISNDSSFYPLLYTNIFARSLHENKVESAIFENSKKVPQSLKILGANAKECSVIIDISNYKRLKNIIQISFNWGDGSPFSLGDVFGLTSQLNLLNYLTVDIPQNKVDFIYSYEHEKYQNQLIQRSKEKKYSFNDSSFTIDFSNINTKDFYEKVLKELNIKYDVVKRKKSAYYHEINEQKSLSKAYSNGWMKKSDASFVINEDGSGLNFTIRHKKVYKYFKPEEIAALYLNFLIEDLKINQSIDLKDYFIGSSVEGGKLVDKIALKHNLTVERFVQRSKNFEKNKKKLLFAYTKNNEFLCYDRLFNGFDSLSFLVEIMYMIDYYKKQGKTLFDKLNEIYSIYNKTINKKYSYNVNSDIAQRFINRIMTSEKLGNKKIVNIQDYGKSTLVASNVILKIHLEGGDTVSVNYSIFDKKIHVYIETFAKNNTEEEILNASIRENEISESIMELKEEYNIKKLNLWNFFKYAFSIVFFIGIFIFLFYTVYNFKSSEIGGSNKASVTEIFSKVYQYIHLNKYTRLAFGFFSFLFIFEMVLNTVTFKRLLSFQKEKCSAWDIFIGSLIGIVVQNITPKSIGGDLATYWYLRRKGIKRQKLIPAIIMNTFVWQVVNILLVVIFVPIGISFYQDIFAKQNANNITFIVFLIIGITVDSVMAILFLVLSLSSKIQKFAIKVLIKFWEWLPFIQIYDVDNKIAKYNYEFFQIRQGLKTTFSKWYYFVEILFYKSVIWLITPLALFAKSGDLLKDGLSGGWYFNVTLANILVRSVNSVSPTPGGSGTSDYFFKTIFLTVLKPENDAIGMGPIARASILTAIRSFATLLIPTVASAILLFIVFIGEKRVDQYKIKEKNLKLVNNNNIVLNVRVKTRFYKIALPIFFTLLFISAILIVTL